MNEDMADFAKSCRTCQVQANLIHTHPISLQNMVTPWPLHTWGLDLSGPVNPPSGKDNWILEPTDYFSKWVEAIPFRKTTGTVVASFIHKHIITRFRVLLNQVLLFYTLLFSRKWILNQMPKNIFEQKQPEVKQGATNPQRSPMYNLLQILQ